MASECCPPVVGGKIYVSWGDKRFEAVHGSARMRITPETRQALATASGKLVVTEEARVPEWEMTFYDICGADPMEMWMAKCHLNVTIVNESTGKRYLWSNGAIVGEPEHDPATGQISGMRMASDDFSFVA